MRFVIYAFLVLVLGSYFFISLGDLRSQEEKYLQLQRQPLNLLSGNIDDYFSSNKNLELVVEKKLQELSNTELAGMVLMPAYEKQHNHLDLKKWIHEYSVGGFMILRPDYDTRDARYVDTLVQKGELPLLVSIDAEPSLVKYRLPSLTNIPATNTLDSESDSASIAGRISGHIAGIGVNLNFAPVYDNNSNFTVIGDRSYGSHSQYIHRLASAFSGTTKDYGIIPTAKHFPGHGNVTGDTHKNLQTINGELDELDQFKLAINDDIPMIMVGHLAIENNSRWDTGGIPASLSREISTDLLKQELGFSGLVITDALNMGALDRFDNVPIRALEAGADIVLLPKDIDTAFIDILNKINADPIFKKDIQQKVRKIIRMKIVLAN